MPPEQANPTAAELQWLSDFMAAEAAQLAQTSGAKAAQDFGKAMGGATLEVQQAWLESEPSAVDEAAKLAVELAGGEVTEGTGVEGTVTEGTVTEGTVLEGTGEDLETIATRIYSKAVDELREDEIVLDDADLGFIWQDAWNEARSWSPETEEEAVTRVTDSFTMKIMNEIDGDGLYEVIEGFIADIRQLTTSGS
jgi:hypothetical protein